jgi:hypothetical protein
MKCNKLFIGLNLSLVILLVGAAGTFATVKTVSVPIFVNDAQMDVFDKEVNKEMPALIYNSRTLMPLKKTFSLFGLEAKWNEKEQSVQSTTPDGKIIWLQIGNKNAKVNSKSISLDVPARVIDNRTYVPLAFIAQAVGREAIWDQKNKIVKIYTDGTDQLDVTALPKNYSNVPSRVNNSIFFDATDGKMIAVSKVDLTFGDAVNRVGEMLYVQAGDFTLTYNEQGTQIAVYQDAFMGVDRSNIIVKKSNTVFILEIRGMNSKEATEFTKKFIK